MKNSVYMFRPFWTSFVISLFLIISPALCAISTSISPSLLMENLQEWDGDLVVVFRLQTCDTCDRLLDAMEAIGEEITRSNELIIASFDCDFSAAHSDACLSLEVAEFPALAFIGYGNMLQTPNGDIFSFRTNPYPRLVRFTADMYVDAMHSWLRMVILLSKSQRVTASLSEAVSVLFGWNWGWNLPLLHKKRGNPFAATRVARLRDEVHKLDRQVALLSAELQLLRSPSLVSPASLSSSTSRAAAAPALSSHNSRTSSVGDGITLYADDGDGDDQGGVREELGGER